MLDSTMTEETKAKGGIAPFGYRWHNGRLMIDETEAPTRKLIYESFLKHKRKKTVAKLLNDLGYRTRNGSLFSDTTIDRLLRDTTAKGIRTEDGKEIKVEEIISAEIWERANNFLGQKQTKPPVNLFVGIAFCFCGGKMLVPSNADKYVCLTCRHKIPTIDLEDIFLSQFSDFRFPLENQTKTERINLADYWEDLSHQEKQIIIDQTVNKIIVGKREIEIEFAYAPSDEYQNKTTNFWQQNQKGNETPNSGATEPNPSNLNEPLINEIEAAKFLGISRMTLLRKRNASEIGFYRVGFRVLYSKEKHLIPFLESCEK